MSNYCLKTSLKAQCDENLLKLGEMRIYFPLLQSASLQQQSFALYVNEAMTLTAINGYFTDSSLTEQPGVTTKDITPNNYVDVIVSNGAVISIPNKYAIVGISMRGSGTPASTPNKYFNIEDLEFSENLTYLTLRYSNCFGDIHVLEGKSLADVDFRDTRVKGEVSVLNGGTMRDIYFGANCDVTLEKTLSNLPNLKTLSIISDIAKVDITKIPGITSLTSLILNGITAGGGKVYGNIASLAPLKKLEVLNIYLNPNIEGNIEDMLNAMHNTYSRTSGTLTIRAGMTDIKYNGGTIPERVDVTFSAGGWSLS